MLGIHTGAMPKLGHTSVSQLRRYSAPGLLRSGLFIAYIAGLLLLFLLITALSNNVNLASVQQEKAQWWRVHTLDVLLTAEQIDTALNKVLRGERGYLLTLHPKSLATFQRGLSDYHRAEFHLTRLTKDNARQQRRIADLDRRTSALFTLATGAVDHAKADRITTVHLLANSHEREIIEDVTALLEKIKAEERALLHQRERMNVVTSARIKLYGQILLGLIGALVLIASGAVAAALRERRAALATARRAEQSERLYRLMADHSNDMIVRIGLDGIRRDISPACRSLLGFEVEELLGATPVAAIHVDDRTRVMKVCRSLLDGADHPICSYRQQHRDGHYVWLEASYRLVRDEAGVPVEFVASVRDIGRRQAAELKAVEAAAHAQESNRLFAMAASLARIGHWRVDLVRGKVAWSNEVYVIYGLGPDHVPTLENAIDPYHPDDRERVSKMVESAITTGASFDYSGTLVIPDGRRRAVNVQGQAECAPDGAVVGIFGVIQDVSAQVAAEETIRASERQYRLLADNSTDVVLRTGNDGTVIYISPSCIEMSGYTPKEIVGRHCADFIHPDDQSVVHAAHVVIVTGQRAAVTVEYRLRHKLDGWRWLESNMKSWLDPGEAVGGVLSAIRDIENRKALELELRDACDRAEAAASAKAVFLANMSHEIRTPMDGVLGFTELVLATDLKPEQRRHLELVADSGRSMMRLLNDILDISKIQSGKMVLANEAVDLRHVIRRCVELMAPMALSKGLRLTTDFDPAVPARILGDPLRLRQILLNLVGNAVKFTGEGLITVVAAIENGVLRIEVSDTGIGIPSDRLTAIFEQFSQADSSIAQSYGGTGLGLSISGDLVRLMGGSISVASVVGRGTTFTVVLPVVEASDRVTDTPTEQRATAPLPKHLRRPRILIAEDHDINQELIAAMAQRAGMDPAIAADGLETIAMVETAMHERRPYQLILMDMQMPRMGGIEATRRLRASGYNKDSLPIVALTANAYSEDVQACLDAGMQDHLAKPLAILSACSPASFRQTMRLTWQLPSVLPWSIAIADAKPKRCMRWNASTLALTSMRWRSATPPTYSTSWRAPPRCSASPNWAMPRVPSSLRAFEPSVRASASRPCPESIDDVVHTLRQSGR